jgi:amino acid adenylation domain-containing protein
VPPQRSVSGEASIPLRPAGLSEFPTTIAQQGAWLAQSMSRSSEQFNLRHAFRIRGALNVPSLSGALEKLADRHEALRTIYTFAGGDLTQTARRDMAVALQLRDVAGQPGPELAASQIAAQEGGRPLDLSVGPPWRAVLIRLRDDDYVLIIAAHHISIDQWSWPIIYRDLAELYLADAEGRQAGLPALSAQPADYALWLSQRIEDSAFQDQIASWLKTMDGISPALDLPLDRPRDANAIRAGGMVVRFLEPELLGQLRAIGRSQSATLFAATIAGFGILLSRYAGKERLIIPVPIATDRFRPELENVVGLLTGGALLKLDVTEGMSFRDLVRQARYSIADIFAYQDVPYEVLMKALQPDEKAAWARPVSFSMQEAQGSTLEIAGLDVSPFPIGLWSPPPPGDITLSIELQRDRPHALWHYDKSVLDHQTISLMASQYVSLLHDAAQRPDIPISELRLAPDTGDGHIAPAATGRPDARIAGSIPEFFAKQARRAPHAVAVTHGDQNLTYGQLSQDSDALARRLIGIGVRPSMVVGVLMERSVSLATVLLAVLKTGAAYLPLDPEFPDARITAMLEDAEVTHVLSQSGLRDRLPRDLRAIYSLDEPPGAAESERAEDGDLPAVHADQLAYVMYTSGSTGRPKGVAITHGGVIGLVVRPNYLHIEPGDRVAQTSSLCSDNITFEFWAPLLNGASVDILEREVVLSPRELADAITSRGISILSVTSAIFNFEEYASVLAGTALRQLFFGGEAANASSVRRLLAGGFAGELVHTYGPTETTMLATYQPIEALRDNCTRVPVGQPVTATEIYIMDKWARPLPPGVPGEICIGGERLARCYVGDPRLTAERFCPNPLPHRAGERMYRTGDLGRRLQNGELEVLGRLDRQVKVRGFRVEPSEVEAVLSRVPEVAQAAVTARRSDEGAGNELFAYVSANPGCTLSAASLRRALGQQLPDQMVPSKVTVLPRLPLTLGGKIDYSSLPEPASDAPPDVTSAPPETARQEIIADTIADLLQLDRVVGIDEDFFALGGHSLVAIQLLSRLQRESGIDIPVGYLLSHPTVAELAAWDGAPAAWPSASGPDGPVRRREPSLFAIGYGAAALSTLVLVHGGGGGLFSYGPLIAALGNRYPCAGLEARDARDASISDLAAKYVEELQNAVPGRPMIFAGWSLGGVIAHEMARIWLAAEGVAPALVMIDSRPYRDTGEPLPYHPLESFTYDVARTAGVAMPDIPPDVLAQPADQALRFVLSSFSDKSALSGLEADALSGQYQRFLSLGEAHRKHVPGEYGGDVTMIGAEQTGPSSDLWRPFCGKIAEMVMPGDHYSVMQISARPIAAEIRATLDRLEAGVGRGN